MFQKILIANRGEIAVRIMRTCREMGIATVAVYSDVDECALHVISADEAVLLGPAEPSESYLNIDKIIAAAQKTGARAIHPGYGFLAENARFASACRENGIVFIGPPPEVIQALGDKIVARRIMSGNGVPVIPGAALETSDDQAWAEAAENIGYPVLIKAAAGGGGKGMRIVHAPENLFKSRAAAESEARAAFGDGSLYMEKYLERARHVEFQILCDTQGNAVHLLERECSIQRRHQKIIEETPSTALTEELRNQMGSAAVAAARASGYVNAGTVEFLLDPDGRFYFLEVNTRLQVEHPITEIVAGVDIVRRQVEIAAGEPLSLSQTDIAGRGHAIECRIYAEDPENGFFPSPGKICFLQEPAGPGIRIDSGVYAGFEAPVEYDPILSKLIVWAETRDIAIQRMIRALRDYVILGVNTPAAFLADVLSSKPFQTGDTFTDFINVYFQDWKNNPKDRDLACAAYLAAALTPGGRTGESGSKIEAVSQSPWGTLGNWRL